MLNLLLIMFFYDGQKIALNDNESSSQAISRYKTKLAQDEADRLETERLANEAKETKRRERRQTPRYKDGTVVLTKDGKYYSVWEGYYYPEDDTVYYNAIPCKVSGDWDIPDGYEDYRWSEFGIELDQRNIQKKVK